VRDLYDWLLKQLGRSPKEKERETETGDQSDCLGGMTSFKQWLTKWLRQNFSRERPPCSKDDPFSVVGVGRVTATSPGLYDDSYRKLTEVLRYAREIRIGVQSAKAHGHVSAGHILPRSRDRARIPGGHTRRP